MALIEICHTLRQNALLIIQLHEFELIICSWIVKLQNISKLLLLIYLYNSIPFS